MGLNVDSTYGGAEAGVIAFSIALTEISKACASTGVAMSVNNLVAEVIQMIGSREQKETYIRVYAPVSIFAAHFVYLNPKPVPIHHASKHAPKRLMKAGS